MPEIVDYHSQHTPLGIRRSLAESPDPTLFNSLSIYNLENKDFTYNSDLWLSDTIQQIVYRKFPSYLIHIAVYRASDSHKIFRKIHYLNIVRNYLINISNNEIIQLQKLAIFIAKSHGSGNKNGIPPPLLSLFPYYFDFLCIEDRMDTNGD